MYARFFRSAPNVRPDRSVWSNAIRQTHRWLAILFTATVIANFVAMALGKVPAVVTYSPLPPLFLLLFSGLYMFVLPYRAKWRSVQASTFSVDAS